MGNAAASFAGQPPPLEPQQSIEGMLKQIHGLQQKDNGKYIDYEGKPIDY